MNTIKVEYAAKLLLSFDKSHDYFINKKMSISNDKVKPIIGNFRLNKILFIIQILYCAKNKTKIFYGKMCAFENGTVFYQIYINFITLLNYSKNSIDNKSKIKEIKSHFSKEQLVFIKKAYQNLKKYSDNELIEFAHEDPKWYDSYTKYQNNKENSDNKSNFDIDEEDIKYYEIMLSDILEEFKL